MPKNYSCLGKRAYYSQILTSLRCLIIYLPFASVLFQKLILILSYCQGKLQKRPGVCVISQIDLISDYVHNRKNKQKEIYYA